MIAVASAAASGCATANAAVHGAIDDYDAGRYKTAVDEFDALESEQADMNARWRVRYLAYRGLANYQLWRMGGDEARRRKARTWVKRAIEAYEASADQFLSVVEQRRLRSVLAELERRQR